MFEDEIGFAEDSEGAYGDSLTERIIGAAIEVHRLLGPGLLETIYEEALNIEFARRGIQCERQIYVDVIYKGHRIRGQKLDLLVEREDVVELKSLANLPEVGFSQTLSYLKATGLKPGLLINSGCKRLVEGIRRVSN